MLNNNQKLDFKNISIYANILNSTVATLGIIAVYNLVET